MTATLTPAPDSLSLLSPSSAAVIAATAAVVAEPRRADHRALLPADVR